MQTLTSLTYLSISTPNITHIPDAISQLTQLQELIISDCPVETLPESIQQLKNLREIAAYKTALTGESAEQFFNAMPQLRHFMHSDNFLRR